MLKSKQEIKFLTNGMENTSELTALIVDDEYDICFLLSRILRANKLAVQFVNSIAEGKSSLLKHKPDVLFLDNHLPDGYGIDFISYVKQQYPATKIIMITAHDTNEDMKRALHEGADVFIAKPFSAQQIKTAIDKVCPS
jgi:DNA-binding NtrC family response regulator